MPSPGEGTGVPAVDKNKGKVWDDVDAAVADIKSGDVVLSAGECSRVFEAWYEDLRTGESGGVPREK